MRSSTYIFDPTIKDTLSKARGIGRYLQILRENFADEYIFSNDLSLLTTNYKPSESEGKLPTVFINPFFELLKPPLLMRRIANKQIAVIHDLIRLKYPIHFPIGIKGRINIFLNKIALKAYDSIITDSEQSKKDIINLLRVDSSIVKVVYPTLPNIFLNPKSQLPNPKQIPNPNDQKINNFGNYCLYVGDVTWNKNLVNLAHAIKLADVPCVFVGKVFEKTNISNLNHPEQKEFKDFLEEIKDDKRFILKGFVEDPELIKLYQQARLNILVSRDEGFGFSYLEAASQYTPSVLSDIPTFKEIAKDTAIYCNPEDPADIAEKIKNLYSSENLRKDLGEKAYERSGFFSQEKFKSEFGKVVDYSP